MGAAQSLPEAPPPSQARRGAARQRQGRTLWFEVIEGRHADARVAIERPFASIGSDVSSDIVLTDADIAPLHATVYTHGGQWLLRRAPLTPPVQVGEQEVGLQPMRLHENDLVRLGGAILKVCGAAAGARVAVASPPRAAPRRTPLLWWAGAACIAGSGALAVMVTAPDPNAGAARTRAAAAAQAINPAPNGTQLTAMLRSAGFAGAAARTEPNGTVVLEGFVRDAAERERLLAQPALRGRALRSQLRLLDEVVQQMARYVDDPKVSISTAAPGRVDIGGQAVKPATRERLTKLEKELGSRLEISNRVTYPMQEADANAAPPVLSSKALDWQVRMLSASSQPPYFETRDGERVIEGGDWRGVEVVKIGTEEVLVRQGGRYQRVRID